MASHGLLRWHNSFDIAYGGWLYCWAFFSEALCATHHAAALLREHWLEREPEGQ